MRPKDYIRNKPRSKFRERSGVSTDVTAHSAGIVKRYNRGIKVLVILDKSQVSSIKRVSAAQFFYDNKIPVWIDRKPRIAHNKIMIIDGKEVITGSYNFSHAAQFNNAENVVFIKSPDISSQYLKNFNSRLAKSFEFNPEK